MIVSLLAAMDRNLVIGNEQGIPWRLPADLKRFRKLTMGKPIIMGRTTFEHIGKPLDGRTNIVLTRQTDFHADGVKIARDFASAIAIAGDVPEIAIIGGGQIYREALPMVNRLYLTFVDGEFTGNVKFPESIPTPARSTWQPASCELHKADERNPYRHAFVIVDRVLLPGAPASDLVISNLMPDFGSAS